MTKNILKIRTPARVKKGTGPHWVNLYIGKRLRNYRLAAHVSQDELGKAVGISFQQIQKYEAGANRISVQMLHEMARALRLQITDFLPPMANRVEGRKLLATEAETVALLVS